MAIPYWGITWVSPLRHGLPINRCHHTMLRPRYGSQYEASLSLHVSEPRHELAIRVASNVREESTSPKFVLGATADSPPCTQWRDACGGISGEARHKSRSSECHASTASREAIELRTSACESQGVRGSCGTLEIAMFYHVGQLPPIWGSLTSCGVSYSISMLS